MPWSSSDLKIWLSSEFFSLGDVPSCLRRPYNSTVIYLGSDILHTLACPFDKTKNLVCFISYFVNMGITGQLVTGK